MDNDIFTQEDLDVLLEVLNEEPTDEQNKKAEEFTKRFMERLKGGNSNGKNRNNR